MPIGGDETMSVVYQAMRGLAARQRATADNVANINTPGYRAKKVSFESELMKAIDTGGQSTIDGVRPGIALSSSPTRLDGNNVNLDEETMTSSKTSLQYSSMLEAMNAQLRLLRSAIKEGRG